MKNNNKKLFKYAISSILIIFIIFIFFKYRKDLSNMSLADMKNYILSYGKFSSIIFVIIYSLKPLVLVIPVSLMSILAGNVFGPYKAILLSMIGCFASGTMAFFLSKFLGRSFVDRLLKGKAMKLDDNIEKHGFKIMAIMRLSFVFPYDPLSYAAGLTKMKYKDFILGTLLGVFPEMIAYSLMGKNLENPFSFKFVAPIIATILLALVAIYVHKRFKNTNNL